MLPVGSKGRSNRWGQRQWGLVASAALVFGLSLLLWPLAAPGRAQGLSVALEMVFQSPARNSDRRFGEAVALSKNIAAIGVTLDDDFRPWVDVYRKTEGGLWTADGRLTPATLGRNDWDLGITDCHSTQGKTIRINSGHIAVGSPRRDVNGAVHLYQRADGVWRETAFLTASDARYGEAMCFGSSIDLSRNFLVVGAPKRDGDGGLADGNRGQVYVFQRFGASWLEVQRLLVPEESAWFFGQSVALHGKRLLVGASNRGLSRTMAYVFEHRSSGWEMIDKIALGRSASTYLQLHGKRVAAAYGALGARSIEVFTRKSVGWSRTAALADGPGAHPQNRFPSSTALHRRTLVVGAKGTRKVGSTVARQGEAYVFRRKAGSWRRIGPIRAPDSLGRTNYFGSDVAVYRDLMLVGASTAKTEAPFLGAAYLYHLD